MTLESILVAGRDIDVMLPLLCSIFAGAMIGAERELHGKPAGVRTHTLVCFASALMTLLGLRMEEWTAALPVDAQIVTDMARMPHAILTGIGFLGAGVIFREGTTVQGLTTAASLWLTAVLGIVFGTGLVELATIGTVIALLVLGLLRLLQTIMPPKPEIRIEVTVSSDSPYDGARLKADLAVEGLRASSMSIRQDRDSGLRRYVLLVSGQDRTIDSDRLLIRLQDASGMQEVAILPLENGPAPSS